MMMNNAFRPVRRGQRGMTLIELMIALAMTVVIGGVIMAVVIQVFTSSARSKAHQVAIVEVERAVHVMNRDIQMAQIVKTNEMSKVVELQWTDWDNNVYLVSYTLVDGQLIREYEINGASTQTIAAEYISAAEAGPEADC
jgi:type II secretory pathway component PulJ